MKLKNILFFFLLILLFTGFLFFFHSEEFKPVKDTFSPEGAGDLNSMGADSLNSKEAGTLKSGEENSLNSERVDFLKSGEENSRNSEKENFLNLDVPEPGGINLEATGIKVTEKQLSSDRSSRDYTWNYGGYEWHLTMLLDDELYQVYKERTRRRDYDLFASDPYDDRLIQNIAETLTKLARQYRLKEKEMPGLCTSFVQSLNYTSDLVSAGYDQYPRFPYETLYENGGDCEDTSILSAAILQEIGYEVILLELPEHMAIGIKTDSGFSGKSFTYNGDSYYYLETTGSEWDIGEMPEEYVNQPVKVIPIFKRPFIDLDFRGVCECSKEGGIVDVNVTMKNVGSETAENTVIYVALQSREKGVIWDEIESIPLYVEPEESYYYTAEGLFVPDGKAFRIYIQAFGENVISEGIMSDWVFLLAGVAEAEFF